jgi:methionyl-tRNA formyltransferase
MLKPSSSQKLLAVRACNRRTAARTAIRPSNMAYRPNPDEGFLIAECASVAIESNDTVIAMVVRLSSANSKTLARRLPRFDYSNTSCQLQPGEEVNVDGQDTDSTAGCHWVE